MRSAIILLALVLLVSFQNCGFSGFVTSLETSTPEATDLSSTNGTTNLTTIPKGQLTRFEIPNQLVSLKLSIIDLSQNQILAYSRLLNKIIAFNTDGQTYQEIVIPDPQVSKILTINPYQKYNMAGSARYLYKNPLSMITYHDTQNKTSYGVFGTKNRSWTRLDFPSGCNSGVRSSGVFNEHIAYCNDPSNSKSYFQKLNEAGQKIGSMVQMAEAVEFSGGKALGGNTLVTSDWTKKVDLSTGAVTSLPSSFASLASSNWVIYRSDINSVIYLSSNYQSLIEKNISTGQERTLLSSQYSFTIHGIDETLFLAYNQDTGVKYLISSMAPSAITTVNSAVAGFATSNKQLALFIPDPTSSSIRITVQLLNMKTLAPESMCSPGSPVDADFYGNLIGYAGFETFFTNSLALDTSKRGMNMAFIMDSKCTTVFMPTIFRSQPSENYIRNLYKYNIQTSQTQIAFTQTIPADGMGYFGNYLALEQGALYFTLPNGRDVYASGINSNLPIGTMDVLSSAESLLNNWNNSVVRMSTSTQITYFLPTDTGKINFSLPKIRSTPSGHFLTNGGNNYVLVTRESDSDTSTTESYSFQFYNEKNALVKKEKINVNIIESWLSPLIQMNPNNPEIPYLGISLMAYVGNKIKRVFVIANLLNQSVSVVEAPLEIEFPYGVFLTPEGNILSFSGFCLVSSKHCISNPLNVNLETTSGSFAFVSNGSYYFNTYVAGKNSLKRYNYDGNLGFTLVKDFGDHYGIPMLDSNWVMNRNYNTNKISVYNVMSGATHELTKTYEISWPVKGGLMGASKEADETYSYWLFDFATMNEARLDDLSGYKEYHYLTYTSGKMINSNASDIVTLYNKTAIVFLNLVTKKVIKKIDMPDGSQPVWEGGSQVVLGQTTSMHYLPAYKDYKYKLTLFDLKSFTEQTIDVSKYSAIVCQNSVRNDLFCIGKKGDSHFLLKFVSASLSFEEITELNSERSFGGLVRLSKDLTFMRFSSSSYIERYMMVMRPAFGEIGDGWEGYVYKQ